MSTSIDTLSRWFDEGLAKGATHMIVVCDTFDHEDYPVFVMPDQDARARADDYNGREMQRVMEVYHLGMDRWAQLRSVRAHNFDLPAEETPGKQT